MKDKIFLVFYIFSVLILTNVHNIHFFLIFLSILILFSVKDFLFILKKTVVSLLFFNAVVSITYVFISVLRNEDWIDFITLFNLRVFSLTYLTFFFLKNVNLFKAFSFSKTAMFLLTLSYSQINNYIKVFNDFKLAYRSRLISKEKKENRYNFIKSVSGYFLRKSVSSSYEKTQALKSRGFFND